MSFKEDPDRKSAQDEILNEVELQSGKGPAEDKMPASLRALSIEDRITIEKKLVRRIDTTVLPSKRASLSIIESVETTAHSLTRCSSHDHVVRETSDEELVWSGAKSDFNYTAFSITWIETILQRHVSMVCLKILDWSGRSTRRSFQSCLLRISFFKYLRT